MEALLDQLSPLNMVLVFGIVWLSGVYVWLLKRFIKSYDENTHALSCINGTMKAMDAKITEIGRKS